MISRLRAAIRRRTAQVIAAVLRWRTRRIDRQYCALGHDLDFCERAVAAARSRTYLRRIALLIRRQELRARIDRLGATK